MPKWDNHTTAANADKINQRLRKIRNRNALTLGLAVIIVELSTLSSSADPSAERGKTFARTNCSQCHSIDRFTPSSLAIAPPFRLLHLRYPVESLEESLAEGIVTGHPSMPEFQLDPGQVSDFIKFLKSLERIKKAG